MTGRTMQFIWLEVSYQQIGIFDGYVQKFFFPVAQ